MKKCSKCGELKELSAFAKNKARADGFNPSCKECKRAYDREYRKKNKEKIDKRVKKWHADNREHVLEYKKTHYQENYDKYEELRKTYYKENKDIITEQNKIWAKNNPEIVAETKKKWKVNNKDKVNAYEVRKRSEDSFYKLKNNMRCLINRVLKLKGYTKKSKTYKILGCSFDELLNHLNDNPYGFVYGDEEIDIDHIVPCDFADTEEELLKLNHYTNLQLLPSTYNRKIKGNNPYDKDHFEEWLSVKIT